MENEDGVGWKMLICTLDKLYIYMYPCFDSRFGGLKTGAVI